MEDEEKELEILKEVLEKGNFSALNNLPINIQRKKAPSAKIPKKLSQKEIEKREMRKQLKEIERIENIQKKLFAGRKGRLTDLKKPTLLSPLKKQTNLPYENKLLKECREMFSDDKKINDLPQEKQVLITNQTISSKQEKPHKSHRQFYKSDDGLPLNTKEVEKERKTTHKEKVEIECDQDVQKDEDFLKKLTAEEKDFYQEQTKDLFAFLQSINLCRFIEDFIKEGYDLYEDVLKLPKNFFDYMERPFLNKMQQKKLFSKIKEVTKKKSTKTENETQKVEEKPKKKNVETCEGGFGEDEPMKKTYTEFGVNAKGENALSTQNEICCCWNCLKPLDKKEAFKINNKGEKYFCSKKCLDAYDKMNKKSYVCFWCNKIKQNNPKFVIHDLYICSDKCKKEYEESMKKDNESHENVSSSNKNSHSEDEGSDNYDPMEDF